MAAGIVSITAKNGAGVSVTTKWWSSDGTDTGDLYPIAVIVDPTALTPLDPSTPQPVSSTTLATVAKQPALGTAGTASADVITVQGKASMTPVDIQGTAAGTAVRVAATQDQYETVAASQTAQALGATGATGDYIAGVLVIPATTSPGNVLLLDNATSITVFTGGASSVSNLVPFFIPLGIKSVSGAWKLTTGASVSCIGVGTFT